MTGFTSRRGAAPVAIAVLLSFGCTTVRVPASAIHDSVPVGSNGAEPQVELWIESGRPVSEEEKARHVAAVRRALDRAVARLVSDNGETLLVVRAQGVARTGSHRADQTAAKVGIAVGAVAAVALVVVALVASKGKGGGGGGSALAPARVAGAVAPRVAPAAPGIAPRVAPAPPRVRMPASRPAAPVAVGVHVDVPLVVVAGPDEPALVRGTVSPGVEGEPGGRHARPPRDPVTLRLPPPRPLDVERRGFFDEDLTRLEVLVVDRASGEPTWVKTVEGKVDPRDADDVQALLARAVNEPEGWVLVRPPR